MAQCGFPRDHHHHLHRAMLLKLPPEILVQILQDLDVTNLFSCQLTTKYLDHLIRGSVILQYNVALDAANAQVNPCVSLTIAENLKALKSAENAWAFLRPDFTASIPVTHNQSGVYDLTGGVYLLSNLTRTALHYLKLPGREGDESDWKVLRSDKSIIDVGLSIFEHDLIVNVVTCVPFHVSNQCPDFFCWIVNLISTLAHRRRTISRSSS